MFSSLILLAAAEAGDAVHAANPITQITQNFGISAQDVIAQVLNFAIVAFVLWRFAFKPVVATLDERQAKIASGLKYAEEMKAKLEATQQETAAITRTAQIESARIIEEARKSAKEFLDRQTQESSARANEILVKAQQAIELERRKMLADARSEIARLVVATTRQVLARELSDADRARYSESAAQELARN